MEFLVHNISHSDLILELTGDTALRTSRNATSLLARPKFSLFNVVSQSIVRQLDMILSPTTVQADTYERQMDSPRFQLREHCTTTYHPVGFRLDVKPIDVQSLPLDLSDFQLRASDETIAEVESSWKRIRITACFFPLLGSLLPKWHQVLSDVHSDESQQLLYLISGAGIPRNASHSICGNSTEYTAELMSKFVATYYPNIHVTQIHSGSNIFRYDDNVQFMTRQLRPMLESHRDVLVAKVGDQWKSHFHLTIAYADGPPARLSALNAALRVYQPSYLHVWQLKTYWHERKLSLDDVDFHPFENVEATPAIAVAELTDPIVTRLVNEVKSFRDQFVQGEHLGEVGQFWLRKSRKPVLAVLLIEKLVDGTPTIVVHRGMNCEVSMPTGSLCAERNAIGSALANDPTLLRQSLKMIAVLSVTLHSHPKQVAMASAAQPPCSSTALPIDAPPPVLVNVPSSIQPSNVERSPKAGRKPKRPRTISCDASVPAIQAALTAVDAATAMAKAEKDLNPLAPCGACNEWLLKIAEANPSFKIVTFDSIDCDSVYIHQLL
ncbi:hypothetical protein H310_11709 [Aphanomyces invadans]|uniref:Uncharacterized protein n=1 Tax=Aphanomyces invadans TaxID=157072 RepID=A0A024TN09_9STRA|nr:hypothetical protein H310_11709 [Aphanomyces invadans]ETV94747.1 hypothetical protein H310_11709 [Aphanomyces invadans]|eukprot:XP_008876692.1 hypothetical protein H310_11709 [Aphanomyces invadans]